MADPREFNFWTDKYTVELRVLYDARGTLLVLTPDQTNLKYSDLRDDWKVRLSDATEAERHKQLTRLDAAEKQELELFALLEKQRSEEFVVHKFEFRVPQLLDFETSEFEAAKGENRSELVFRRELAQRTLVKTDYPDFTDFGSLRLEIAMQVLSEVARRTLLKQDVRDFLLRGEDASVGDLVSLPN